VFGPNFIKEKRKMLTGQLLSYIQRYQYFQDKRISITPDLAYLGGSWAQAEICSELLCLEKKITLAIIANQEEYVFSPATVSAATATSPVRLTVTAHPFNTGDTIQIGGILGLTGANGYFTCTKVNANTISLDGSTGGGAWTSGGTVYHCLSSAVDIKMISRSEYPFGPIKRKQIHTAQEDRAYMIDSQGADTSGGPQPGSYSVIYEDPIRLTFQPKPTANTTVNLVIWRKPLPSEALSASVNPIIPAQFDKALYLGALVQVLELLQLEEAAPVIAQVRQVYQEEVARQAAIMASTRRVRKESTKSFKWS
jgi:hypothetical protein